MADRAIRDFGALPTYPPSAPHNSNKIFVSERMLDSSVMLRGRGSPLTQLDQLTRNRLAFPGVLCIMQSTTAARAWNATPSPSAAGPVSISPSHHHHKARTSFPLAKFRPNLWEEAAGGEAKVERDLASWQTGWATDRSGQRSSGVGYQSDNPYTRSASSHAAIAASASAGGPRRDRWQQAADSFHADSYSYSSYTSPRGHGGTDHHAASSASSSSVSTMTEPFGEYGSVLARVTELAAQVKHLYKLNSTLESNLQTKTRQMDEMRSNHEARNGDPESTGAKMEQMQDLAAAHAALQASHTETLAELAALREKSSSYLTQLQSQTDSLSAALSHRDSLLRAREMDAIELGKMSQLREEVRVALADCARRDEERRVAEEALAHRENQLSQSEEALQARLAAAQRMAEEAAARQASLEAQTPALAALHAEQEKLLALQTQELERLRAAAAAERKVPEDHPELAAARSSVAQLQAHNASLGADLVAREKMIADLLASSVYRRSVLAENKEKNMTAEERAKLAKKKSSVCSIM